ncbi:MAG: hypothetical protein NXH90_17525, partial [Flavobacteriaceae bacterium]|nr:hypothetical protein [Flavobacteriaceae bacterium]
LKNTPQQTNDNQDFNTKFAMVQKSVFVVLRIRPFRQSPELSSLWRGVRPVPWIFTEIPVGYGVPTHTFLYSLLLFGEKGLEMYPIDYFGVQQYW